MTRPRGFAAISPERRQEIARKGGKRAHELGRAHTFTPETARAAGKKGAKQKWERDRAALGPPPPPAAGEVDAQAKADAEAFAVRYGRAPSSSPSVATVATELEPLPLTEDRPICEPCEGTGIFDMLPCRACGGDGFDSDAGLDELADATARGRGTTGVE